MKYLALCVVLLVFAVPAFSDDLADLKAAEIEIQIKRDAEKILNRALGRAWKAIDKSSLTKEMKEATRKERDLWKKLQEQGGIRLSNPYYLQWSEASRRCDRLHDYKIKLLKKLANKFILDEARILQVEKKDRLLRRLKKLAKEKGMII